MWHTFDVNVLVNGNRCKQYNHDGRTYIEAKDGSEWFFQIQNNTSGRVLAVCSVDGLNVLTGETAKPEDTGYIIDAYHAQKIKGFRFSDDEWALFKFGYKLNGKTYAQSKENGAERNCGVIGVRLFYEKPPKVEYIPVPDVRKWPVQPPLSWHCGNAVSSSYSVNWSPGGSATNDAVYKFSTSDMTTDHYIPVRGNSTNKNSRTYSKSMVKKVDDFDMGTEWGRKETSKVVTVDFERGCEAQLTDIYYASRDNLIDMGVPITNNLKINRLPESFPSKYAKPPKGWVRG